MSAPEGRILERVASMADRVIRSSKRVAFGDTTLSVWSGSAHPLSEVQAEEVMGRINAQLDSIDQGTISPEDQQQAAVQRARLEGLRAGILVQQGRLNANSLWGIRLFDFALSRRQLVSIRRAQRLRGI